MPSTKKHADKDIKYPKTRISGGGGVKNGET